MIDLRVTKQRFKNHIYYAKWQYTAVIAAAIVLFSIAYTVTRPVVPKQYKVNISIISLEINEEMADVWEDNILSVLEADQQQVNISSSTLGLKDESIGYQAYELILAKMVANEDDIYIMPKEVFENFAQQGAFIALDDIEKKYEYANDINLNDYKFSLNSEKKEQTHLYGLPLDSVLGLNQLEVEPKGMVIAIAVGTKNEKNARITLDYILSQTQLLK